MLSEIDKEKNNKKNHLKTYILHHTQEGAESSKKLIWGLGLYIEKNMGITAQHKTASQVVSD